MLALHQLLGGGSHIVAEVVEAKLIVCSESDVAVVGGTALRCIGLSLVDAINRDSVEHVERAHPLRVALGEVVVHRDHMHAVSGERIEEHRERSHEGLTLTCSHLGNLAFVEHDTTYELHVVVNHVPSHLISTGNPVVVIDSLVAIDFHEVLSGSGKVAVELCGSHFDALILRKAAGGVLHHGKHLGEHLVELILKHVEHFLLEFVDFFPHRFALLIFEGFHVLFQLGDFLALRSHALLEGVAHSIDACTQLIVGQLLDFGVDGLDFVHDGHNLLEVASRLVAKQRFDKISKSHLCIFRFLLFFSEKVPNMAISHSITICKDTILHTNVQNLSAY